MEKGAEPKRRNAVKTRARILAAAFEAFARHGYAQTGIREIATRSGVASSLIVRYFGSKSNLFREALIHGIYTSSVFTQDKAKFGQRMAKLMVSDGDVNSAGRLSAMTVLAIADPESKDVTQKVTERHVIEPLAEWLGPPNAKTRAMNMFAVMTGFTIQMRHLSKAKIPPESVRWLAGVLQDIVDNR